MRDYRAEDRRWAWMVTFAIWLMVAAIVMDLTLLLAMDDAKQLLWFVVHFTIMVSLLWSRDIRRKALDNLDQMRAKLQMETEAFEQEQQEIIAAMRRDSW